MNYYFIKTDHNYYGKNKFLLDIHNGKYDDYDIALQIIENGYKSQQAAKKGIKSLRNYFKKLNINNNKYEIAKTTVYR